MCIQILEVKFDSNIFVQPWVPTIVCKRLIVNSLPTEKAILLT